MNVPIITNNQIRFGGNLIYMQQDKKVSHYPTGDDVRKAINKFISLNMHKGESANSAGYLNSITEDLRKMLGV